MKGIQQEETERTEVRVAPAETPGTGKFFSPSVISRHSVVRITWPKWTEAIPPYAIGVCAAFWTIQRTFSFYGF